MCDLCIFAMSICLFGGLPGPNGATRRSTIPSFLALSAFTVLPVRAKSRVVGMDVRAGSLNLQRKRILKLKYLFKYK